MRWARALRLKRYCFSMGVCAWYSRSSDCVGRATSSCLSIVKSKSFINTESLCWRFFQRCIFRSIYILSIRYRFSAAVDTNHVAGGIWRGLTAVQGPCMDETQHFDPIHIKRELTRPRGARFWCGVPSGVRPWVCLIVLPFVTLPISSALSTLLSVLVRFSTPKVYIHAKNPMSPSAISYFFVSDALVKKKQTQKSWILSI